MRHFTAAVRSFEFIVINLAPQSTVAIRVLMPSNTSPLLPGSELLIQTSLTLSGTDKVATQYSKGFVSSLSARCCSLAARFETTVADQLSVYRPSAFGAYFK